MLFNLTTKEKIKLKPSGLIKENKHHISKNEIKRCGEF